MNKQTDYTEIRDDRIRTKICELMSAMLDNPDKHGIFPTAEFMWKMETFILGEIAKTLTTDQQMRTFAISEARNYVSDSKDTLKMAEQIYNFVKG